MLNINVFRGLARVMLYTNRLRGSVNATSNTNGFGGLGNVMQYTNRFIG